MEGHLASIQNYVGSSPTRRTKSCPRGEMNIMFRFERNDVGLIPTEDTICLRRGGTTHDSTKIIVSVQL
jgi:hypothetical protein